jgi:hypothetical protein
MRIEAQYLDGFTEQLLRWKLEVNEGKAYLEADWFKCPSPLRLRFRFDEGPFQEALPSISALNEEYAAPWEDLEDCDLVVKDGERTIHRHVCGASVLITQHPELENFLSVWRLIETAVMAHLPQEFQPGPDS